MAVMEKGGCCTCEEPWWLERRDDATSHTAIASPLNRKQTVIVSRIWILVVNKQVSQVSESERGEVQSRMMMSFDAVNTYLSFQE